MLTFQMRYRRRQRDAWDRARGEMPLATWIKMVCDREAAMHDVAIAALNKKIKSSSKPTTADDKPA